jgi:hypothetical protein
MLSCHRPERSKRSVTMTECFVQLALGDRYTTGSAHQGQGDCLRRSTSVQLARGLSFFPSAHLRLAASRVAIL